MPRTNSNRPCVLEIRQASNGFVVATRSSREFSDTLDDALVFQTMNGLVEYIREHFDHRTGAVLVDPLPYQAGRP
jgi:hypothetical protein